MEMKLLALNLIAACRKFLKIKQKSAYIPFDIQSQIIKRLPVKSLIQFRSVSKQWKSLIDNPEFIKDYHFSSQVFVDGVIYFHDIVYSHGIIFNYVISFDLKSEKFGEVCLPDTLVHEPHLNVTKVNELLCLLEYYHLGYKSVCAVWSRKDGADKPFTKISTLIFDEGKWVYNKVLGFRNNGEVVIEVDEPLSGHNNDVGINGKRHVYFSARSYMGWFLDSIIH